MAGPFQALIESKVKYLKIFFIFFFFHKIIKMPITLQLIKLFLFLLRPMEPEPPSCERIEEETSQPSTLSFILPLCNRRLFVVVKE